jgi:hypothetical protein
MNENSSVVWFRQPDEIDDPLTNTGVALSRKTNGF